MARAGWVFLFLFSLILGGALLLTMGSLSLSGISSANDAGVFAGVFGVILTLTLFYLWLVGLKTIGLRLFYSFMERTNA